MLLKKSLTDQHCTEEFVCSIAVHSSNDQNQKELYCQVCLHTQGICLGVRSFHYRSTNIVQTTYN